MERANFELKKFGFDKSGRIECVYIETEKIDDITLVTEKRVKMVKPVPGKLGGVMEALAAVAVAFMEKESLTLSSVAFAGKDENVGVTLSGTWRTSFGVVKFKLPRIKYKNDDSEVSARLTALLPVFCDAVFEYLTAAGVEMEEFNADDTVSD